jgi:C-terminal processing protease CtpA/Prc
LHVAVLQHGQGQTEQQFTPNDRESAEATLARVHDVLKHNYYDPTFRGIDIDERYKSYLEQIKSAKSIQAAYRVVEAYLVGLNDSHTIFIPPANANHVAYGFRLRMIGDQCFITDVSPDSDAAQKLHPGDQVLSLDGYALNRNDLWQLEYYLYRLPPRRTTDFILRDVSGSKRQESIVVEFQKGEAMVNRWSPSLARMQMEKWQQNIKSRSAKQGDVLLWKLASFNEDEGSLSHMLGEALKHRALILDLRGNAGGSERNLAFVLGGFFDRDLTIANQTMRNRQKPLIAKSRGRSTFTGQLIVLIDSRSASASEILARVVQIEHRGTVLGDRSSGSVMAAQFFPLSSETGSGPVWGAEITVADMIMGDGKSIENIGVTPDSILLPTAADIAAARDPVLSHAVGLAGGNLHPDAAGKIFPYEWPSVDPTKN